MLTFISLFYSSVGRWEIDSCHANIDEEECKRDNVDSTDSAHLISGSNSPRYGRSSFFCTL
jgi:hypothetical protein